MHKYSEEIRNTMMLDQIEVIIEGRRYTPFRKEIGNYCRNELAISCTTIED